MNTVFTKFLLIVKRVSIFRTIYYNFKLLPFGQAKKLPILIGRSVVVRGLTGKIKIDGKIKSGMVSFGVITVFRDNPSNKSFLDINGEVTFHGHAIFRTGINFNVEDRAKVEIGENFMVGADSVIYAREGISFGNNCRLSWNTQIIDTDFHYTKDLTHGTYSKNCEKIKIGNNVWICNHVSIGKGAELQDGTIVSSHSFVNKKFAKGYCVLGGLPAKVIKEGVERVFDLETENRLIAQEQCQNL